jgi:hypothetical protein
MSDAMDKFIERRISEIGAIRSAKQARSDAWRERHQAQASKSEPAKCGAQTRRGTACIRKARPNGRCRNHGGCSTGPRSELGKRIIAEAQRKRWASWRAARGEAQSLGQDG